MAYVRGGGPIGGRVAGGGEPTRDSSSPKDLDAWRGLNRQKTKADGRCGHAERPTREAGDGSGGMCGGAMPSAIGGSVGSIKTRDSSPPKTSTPSFGTYRVPPPDRKRPANSTPPRNTAVKLSPEQVEMAVQLFAPLGYSREKAIQTYARHHAEIEGKK